jgi:hypothetical protein
VLRAKRLNFQTGMQSISRSRAAAISAFSCGRPSRRPDTATPEEQGGVGALAEQCETVSPGPTRQLQRSPNASNRLTAAAARGATSPQPVDRSRRLQ